MIAGGAMGKIIKDTIHAKWIEVTEAIGIVSKTVADFGNGKFK